MVNQFSIAGVVAGCAAMMLSVTAYGASTNPETFDAYSDIPGSSQGWTFGYDGTPVAGHPLPSQALVASNGGNALELSAGWDYSQGKAVWSPEITIDQDATAVVRFDFRLVAYAKAADSADTNDVRLVISPASSDNSLNGGEFRINNGTGLASISGGGSSAAALTLGTWYTAELVHAHTPGFLATLRWGERGQALTNEITATDNPYGATGQIETIRFISNGTINIDNISFGEAVPEPASLGMFLLGGALLARRPR